MKDYPWYCAICDSGSHYTWEHHLYETPKGCGESAGIGGVLARDGIRRASDTVGQGLVLSGCAHPSGTVTISRKE